MNCFEHAFYLRSMRLWSGLLEVNRTAHILLSTIESPAQSSANPAAARIIDPDAGGEPRAAAIGDECLCMRRALRHWLIARSGSRNALECADKQDYGS
jgi:hypothetical protein